MTLILSDTAIEQEFPKSEDFEYIDLSTLDISNCIGCFGCWVKTPGKCVIRDDAVSIYPLIAKSDKIIYISRLFYGSYDITMKTLLERSIPIQKPFIRIYNGETHHEQRDVKEKDAVLIAYCSICQEEKDIFNKLIERNAKNMLFKSWKVVFSNEDELEKVIKDEVELWVK